MKNFINTDLEAILIVLLWKWRQISSYRNAAVWLVRFTEFKMTPDEFFSI